MPAKHSLPPHGGIRAVGPSRVSTVVPIGVIHPMGDGGGFALPALNLAERHRWTGKPRTETFSTLTHLIIRGRRRAAADATVIGACVAASLRKKSRTFHHLPISPSFRPPSRNPSPLPFPFRCPARNLGLAHSPDPPPRHPLPRRGRSRACPPRCRWGVQSPLPRRERARVRVIPFLRGRAAHAEAHSKYERGAAHAPPTRRALPPPTIPFSVIPTPREEPAAGFPHRKPF